MPRRRRSSPGPYLLHLELLRERISDPNRFPYTVPAIRHLEKLVFHPKVTFLIGENGTGKSTLLEAIAVAYGLNPEGGGRNFNFTTRSSHSKLDEAIRLAKTPNSSESDFFLRAESFYNVATEVDRLDKLHVRGIPLLIQYGGASLHHQSHGESFFALFQNRFRQNGFYLVDEPEAALSPKRQMQFLAILHHHVRNGCQFVIATHSPIIMAYPEACIYQLDPGGIRETAYKDTEHFLITRGFLSNPERMLSELLAERKEG